MKVFSACCKNCLLSKDRIVSGKRARDIIKKCVREQSYFICHKASTDDKDIMCYSFYERFGHFSQMLRIAERLNCIEFIPQPEHGKLISHNEIKQIVN